MLYRRLLTDELRSVCVEPEEVRGAFDDRKFLLRKFREPIADELLDRVGIEALVDRILGSKFREPRYKRDEHQHTANRPG